MSKYWEKALDAAASARILSEASQYDGAANRAYYAMFNAARAAIEAKTSLNVDDIRRHTAILQLFSLHVVKSGLVAPKLSADLNEAFEARAIADYGETQLSGEDARQLVRLMEDMLSAVRPLLGEDTKR